MVLLYVVAILLVGFLAYVCMFGASSSGTIGELHHVLTGCPCLRPCFRLLCGPRCTRFFGRIENACCWRPNPALQLFYVALMAGGFTLFAMHSLPHFPNPRLANWHRYTAYATMLGGAGLFIAASFADPGTVNAATLHRFSTVPFDDVVRRPTHTLLTPTHPLSHSRARLSPSRAAV